MNVFGGSAVLDVMQLARHRELDPARLNNLLMKEKTVALPSRTRSPLGPTPPGRSSTA